MAIVKAAMVFFAMASVAFCEACLPKESFSKNLPTSNVDIRHGNQCTCAELHQCSFDDRQAITHHKRDSDQNQFGFGWDEHQATKLTTKLSNPSRISTTTSIKASSDDDNYDHLVTSAAPKLQPIEYKILYVLLILLCLESPRLGLLVAAGGYCLWAYTYAQIHGGGIWYGLLGGPVLVCIVMDYFNMLGWLSGRHW